MKVKNYYELNQVYNKPGLLTKIKIALCFFYSLSPLAYLITLIHNIFTKEKSFKYQVSLCLIFKDEAAYLKEWLEYHLLLGVDHFYLYNNNSSDDYNSILSTYIDAGYVTLFEWRKNYAQTEAYMDCYNKFKNETHWLGFIDADEFINLSVETGNDIKYFLNKFKKFPSVFLFWRIFGTSGNIHPKKNQLIIEDYTSCWPWLYTTGKSFINNNYNFKINGAHWNKSFYLGFPLPPVTTNKTFCYDMVYPFNLIKPSAVINHYINRSLEEAKYKTYVKTDVYRKEMEDIRKKNGIYFFELNCSQKDFSIQRWLTKLKEKIK